MLSATKKVWSLNQRTRYENKWRDCSGGYDYGVSAWMLIFFSFENFVIDTVKSQSVWITEIQLVFQQGNSGQVQELSDSRCKGEAYISFTSVGFYPAFSIHLVFGASSTFLTYMYYAVPYIFGVSLKIFEETPLYFRRSSLMEFNFCYFRNRSREHYITGAWHRTSLQEPNTICCEDYAPTGSQGSLFTWRETVTLGKEL